jgi:peptide/nickel transport system permease protein
MPVLVRVTRGAVVMLAVSFLTFVLVNAAPGSFVDELRLDPRMSPGTIRALVDEFGLDEPLFVRYTRWITAAAHGHLGYSLTYRVPVEDLIVPRARNTIELTLTALTVAWTMSLLVGIGAAVSRPAVRNAVDLVVSAGLATPDVLLVFVLVSIVTELNLGGDAFVPAVAALALSLAPVLVRHVQQALTAELPRPLVTALVARGLTRGRVVVLHGLRLAASPLAALAGLSFGTLLSASVIVEVVLGWPGVGPLMLEAVLARDVHVTTSLTLAACLLLLIGNAIADLLVWMFDPQKTTGR